MMKLHDSKWLAEKLNLSISTIEKLRSEQPDELPQPIILNKTIRYCELHVDWWLHKKIDPNVPDFDQWLKAFYGQQNLRIKLPKSQLPAEEEQE